MEKDLPNKSSIYAAEGTAAHELGERCLREDTVPSHYEGSEIKVDKDDLDMSFPVNQNMIDAVESYVDYCRPLMGEHMIEEKLQLPFLGKGTKGTADFIGLKDGVLNVVDYKHGRGVPVDAEGNIQGLCYGLGAAEVYKDKKWDTLRITIVQPRAYHELGPIRTWDVPRDELFDWMMDFAEAAVKTEDPDAPLAVGEHCTFCRAKPMCPKHVEFVEEVMDMDLFDDTSKPVPVNFIKDEDLANIVLNKVKLIEKWCQSVKDLAQQRAEEGNALPGTKLVKTREVRMWVDKASAEKELEKRYGSKVFEQKFMTAPKVEKAIGKEEFGKLVEDGLVDKISTGVTLVPESDPRPNARPSAEDEFGSIY
jgi:hypothetical protein